MLFILKRIEFTDNGIFGSLVSEDKSFVCDTLEHAYRSGSYAGWMPKLPKGEYKCIRGEHRLSNDVPFEAFEITGVIGHKGILFHPGNFNKDSEGCVLLGHKLGNHLVDSRMFFEQFMDKLKDINEFTLEVE